MALTAEQKEQRRLATNASNRAYRARYRELSAAKNAVRAEINARFAHATEDELDKALAHQFPDLSGSARYNAACWKPIKNYL